MKYVFFGFILYEIGQAVRSEGKKHVLHKPDDLSLVAITHQREDKTNSQKLSSGFYVCTLACMGHTHT